MSQHGKARLSPIRKVLNAFDPRVVKSGRTTKKIMSDFASKLGLVYFGYVDQRNDEHHLVRGLTLSPTHRDSHYCIGSIEGYDMVLLRRKDMITFPGKDPQSVNWLILAIDLHQAADLPHIFLGSGSHSETFYANLFMTFSHLRRIYFGTLEKHSQEFVHHYSIFTSYDRALESEKILSSEVTDMIGKHFRPLEIEIEGDNLYIYADNMAVTPELLDAMVKNGLWLASHIDKNHIDAHNNHIEGVDALAA